MSVNVEIMDKLERKITLTLPVQAVEKEVSKRLNRLAREVKMDGFRPGKVPMSVVEQRYGRSVHYEVMNDQIGQAFTEAAQQAQLRVAGQPTITEKDGGPDAHLSFEAVFEVYPDINMGDLSAVEIEKINTQADEAAIDRTLDILRKQRCTFTQRPQSQAAEKADRVTIDFTGKIDGEPFAGSQADAFQFTLGEGQMLNEFEDAVCGMKLGESKTFPLVFPENYHSKEVAGKTADFLITVKKIEISHLPEIDDALASALGVSGGTVEALRENIKQNLEREIKNRLQARNKQIALNVLLDKAELDIPKSIVQDEIARLIENARAELKQRGVKDADQAPIPEDLFREQAQRRVRLGLIVANLIKTENLQPTAEQINAHIQEVASSYEKPEDVVRWYHGDAERIAQVRALLAENNVTDFVFSKAKTTDKLISFEDLMKQ